MGVEPVVEPLAGKLAHQDHGISNWPVGAVGVRHSVQGDGDLVEVALPVDAGGVDELLVFGDAAGRLEVFVQEGANGLEVDIENAVGFREQAGSLRRGLGAQEDGEGQQEQDRDQYPERSSGASVHLGPSEIRYHSGLGRRVAR